MFAQSETSVKPGKPFKVTSRMRSQDSPVGPKKLSGQSRNASSNPIQSRDEVRKESRSQRALEAFTHAGAFAQPRAQS